MIRYLTVFWFRRDLRLIDNRALFDALSVGKTTRCIFIFDQNILEDLSDRQDKRVSFLHEKVRELRGELNRHGSDLWVYYGKPEAIFEKMLRIHPILQVVAGADFEPYGIARDKSVQSLCESYGVNFKRITDHLIFEPDAIVKEDGTPYQVFTAYKKRWLSNFTSSHTHLYNTVSLLNNLQHCGIGPKQITLDEMGFERVIHCVPDINLENHNLKQYEKTRDIPSLDATSRLSVHLRFGTVSVRQVVKMAIKMNDTFLSELIWREFFAMLLFFYPETVIKCFKPAYESVKWINNKDDFKKWCNGETGYALVDAGMHELNASGFMHNRVRMITAGFLCKHLLIDWRWGEAYFAQKLNDFELSSNVGNWQWAAGTGCDAAPYFRIFNPITQQQKFDPDNEYILKWNGDAVKEKMISHEFARERCLSTFKTALNKQGGL